MFNPKKYQPEHSLKRRGLIRNCDCRQLQDHRSLHPSFAEVANLKKLSVWTMDTLGITRMLYE